MDRGNDNLPCVANSITSIISGDGNYVYLCGRLNIYDWIPPIGNIKGTIICTDLEWKGKKKTIKYGGRCFIL